MKNAFSLVNVSFRYGEGEKTILDNASYDFEYGKFYLIYGASGGGKSTILSILNGRIPHYVEGQLRGQIIHDGKDIYEDGIAQRGQFISSLFQNPDEQILFDKVEDEIAFPLENQGVPREKMKEAVYATCSSLKLDPKAKTRTLSGGEKQRLEGACALALDNKIFLLDEPLANLDKESSELLLGRLKKKAEEEGACIILVEHRLDSLSKYVDVALKVEGGKIVEQKDVFSGLEGEIPPNSSSVGEESLLRAEKLVFEAGGKRIVDEVSLELKKGERLLILGDNGAGKTSLLRSLSGLAKLKSGKIYSPYMGKSRKWFSNVGYLFQNPDYQLFCKSVREEIYLGKVDEEYAAHLIGVFNLGEMLDKHPLSLSEGQKRKLTFISVLAKKPKILFLDEPTVGQDFESLKILVDEANRLVRENGTALISITHDRRCMRALMDRCLIIDKGRIAEEGGEEVLAKYLEKIR